MSVGRILGVFIERKPGSVAFGGPAYTDERGTPPAASAPPVFESHDIIIPKIPKKFDRASVRGQNLSSYTNPTSGG